MSYTYDPSTNIGRVRRTFPDRVEESALWSDEEIQSFLDDEDSDWRRATALALETTASDEALTLKSVRIHNLETNSHNHAKVLLDRAKLLRQQAKDAEGNSGDSWDIAEWIITDQQYAQRILNQSLIE